MGQVGQVGGTVGEIVEIGLCSPASDAVGAGEPLVEIGEFLSFTRKWVGGAGGFDPGLTDRAADRLAFNQFSDAGTRGKSIGELDIDAAGRFVQVAEPDGDGGWGSGERLGDAGGPFDQDDAVGLRPAGRDGVSVPAERVEIVAGCESIGIDMDESTDAAAFKREWVFTDEDKGGAADQAVLNAERSGEATDEGRLAGAEVAFEKEEVAAAQDRPETRSERLGVLGAGAGSGEGGHGEILAGLENQVWSQPSSRASMDSAFSMMKQPEPDETVPMRVTGVCVLGAIVGTGPLAVKRSS